MFRWLAKWLIKREIPQTDASVRKSYIFLSGTLGIILNALLFATKLTCGLLLRSIAITGDAFNNLTDASSAIIAVISSKVSNKDADSDHPFGHGRFEYISSLMIAFIIAMVGVEVIRKAVRAIVSCADSDFSIVGLILMVVALFVKIWIWRYNRYVDELLDSPVNRAVAQDSINDVCGTLIIIVSIVTGYFTTFPVDGVAGLLVGFYIVYSGFDIARDMTDKLMGSAVDENLLHRIEQVILEDSSILGMHDCHVHDYGAGKYLAYLHIEVDKNLTLEASHTIADNAETRMYEKLGINTVIHVDPQGVEEK